VTSPPGRQGLAAIARAGASDYLARRKNGSGHAAERHPAGQGGSGGGVSAGQPLRPQRGHRQPFHLDAAGSRDRFLLNAFGLHWSEITASNLLVFDGEGRVVEGEGEVETTAFCIHAPIHLANERAACILRTHMPYATALSMVEDGRLEPASQNALRYWNDVAYDDYNGLALATEEGKRLAALPADKRVLLMASHGNRFLLSAAYQ
jgi:ribulose-5-phosphate 4-epimerase/fuculose-1-phosphate aldolase